MSRRPLAGRRVATTRDAPGRLDSLLAERGADVVHVPLIEIADPPDRALDRALADLGAYDWVAVTSTHGARRVATAVAHLHGLRTAAVGTRTADAIERVTGRPVDVVPGRQTAADLVAEMPEPAGRARVLVAQADRADATLADGLRARGYDVDAVVAYTTRLRVPTAAERAALERADAVAFASGSAVTAWVDAIGTWAPPCVVVIGPTTAAAAERGGLQIAAVAADHSVEGLADAITVVLRDRP